MNLKLTPRYGLDAPNIIFMNLGLSILEPLTSYGIYLYLSDKFHFVAVLILCWGIVAGFISLILAGLMIFSSSYGKVKVIHELVRSLDLKGNENILDVGCGQGLALNTFAKVLPYGNAVGIDIWRSKDLSNNTISHALHKALIENVNHRINIKTEDMRQLSFNNCEFDLAISSLAIHNLYTKEDRKKAIREIIRVLKPEGKIILLDFKYIKEYYEELKNLNALCELKISNRNYWMFPPTRILIGKKSKK